MGLQQSKDQQLYDQVNLGNVEAVKALRSEGAGLEWMDRESKTPLIAACMKPELYNVAETLIDLGANVNAYRPGRQAGTPLHHAARCGLYGTVNLLLSHGANALVMNDDYQTPLDVARAGGYNYVVRAIEDRLCLFSGWLLEFYGLGFLNLLAPQLLSRKVWVVILPCGSRNLQKPLKLELAIYNGAQESEPRTIVPLWKSNLEEPNFNQPDPVATISDISRMPRRWRRRRALRRSQEARNIRIKLGPLNETEKEQLRRFCNACKGIPQVVVHPAFPFQHQQALDAPAAVAQHENQSASSIVLGINEGPPSPSSATSSHSTDSSSVDGYDHRSNGDVEQAESKAGPSSTSTFPMPSAPPGLEHDSRIHYPSIDLSSLLDDKEMLSEKKEEGAPSSTPSNCSICLDAPVEGACVPCGHLAGCMSCLNEIKAKNWGCPVCRSKIDQVMRIYTV